MSRYTKVIEWGIIHSWAKIEHREERDKIHYERLFLLFIAVRDSFYVFGFRDLVCLLLFMLGIHLWERQSVFEKKKETGNKGRDSGNAIARHLSREWVGKEGYFRPWIGSFVYPLILVYVHSRWILTQEVDSHVRVMHPTAQHETRNEVIKNEVEMIRKPTYGKHQHHSLEHSNDL